jgi:hypothetical protein
MVSPLKRATESRFRGCIQRQQIERFEGRSIHPTSEDASQDLARPTGKPVCHPLKRARMRGGMPQIPPAEAGGLRSSRRLRRLFGALDRRTQASRQEECRFGSTRRVMTLKMSKLQSFHSIRITSRVCDVECWPRPSDLSLASQRVATSRSPLRVYVQFCF